MTITKALPVEKIREVKINENNEPLVQIFENEKLILLKEHKFLVPLLRKSVSDLLTQASQNLPDNYKILVVTAYRPMWMQKKLWRARLWQMAKKHPLKMIFNYSNWKRETRKYTSPPGGSSHQCGAAVDITLLDSNNNRVDMGTTLTDFGEKVNTYSEQISTKQKENRKILLDAMAKSGFINYPLEWWHYSYGDRMWAAYSQKTDCFYGQITTDKLL
jgi:D-alanyl-D-alanine dipeptidase